MFTEQFDDDSEFPIFQYEIQGAGFHHVHALSTPAEDHHEFLARGQEKLGSLGYSLLRSEIYGKRRHRHRRIQMLLNESQAQQQEHEVALASGNATAIRHSAHESGLLAWEFIGLLAEFCEQLAALFEAVATSEPESRGLSQRLLAFYGTAWETIADDRFRDVAWWLSELGIEEAIPSEIRQQLTGGPLEMAEAMFREARELLRTSLEQVTKTYTQPVHRVAQLRKHSYPVLTDYGFEWLTSFPESDGSRAASVMVHSPFTVVNEYKGKYTGFSVPGDWWAIRAVLRAVSAADWLLFALTTAVLSRAENRTALPLVLMSVGEKWPTEDRVTLGLAYSGYSRETHSGLAQEKQLRESQLAAARTRLIEGHRDSNAPHPL